ncbi:MAG: hypothetical protein Q7J65_05185 [Candidatus Marinimicrobia bacterium]|nr:hypothetical protein [Candidatus Neomarinimicrobiota bacterium]
MNSIFIKYQKRIFIIFCLFGVLNSGLPAFMISGHVADMVTENNLSQVNVIIISDEYAIRDTVLTNFIGEWEYASEFSTIDHGSILPKEFRVSQNYPAKGTPLEQSL